MKSEWFLIRPLSNFCSVFFFNWNHQSMVLIKKFLIGIINPYWKFKIFTSRRLSEKFLLDYQAIFYFNVCSSWTLPLCWLSSVSKKKNTFVNIVFQLQIWNSEHQNRTEHGTCHTHMWKVDQTSRRSAVKGWTEHQGGAEQGTLSKLNREPCQSWLNIREIPDVKGCKKVPAVKG